MNKRDEKSRVEKSTKDEKELGHFWKTEKKNWAWARKERREEKEKKKRKEK
jgi:hypothetical protein